MLTTTSSTPMSNHRWERETAEYLNLEVVRVLKELLLIMIINFNSESHKLSCDINKFCCSERSSRHIEGDQKH